MGDPLSLTNPDGQVTGYTYNSAGLVASETLADGSKLIFTYDAAGNMITASGATGVITLAYNSADELTSVAYPDGHSLGYTYDGDGQRTRMVEYSGTRRLKRSTTHITHSNSSPS